MVKQQAIKVSECQKVMLDRLKINPNETYISVMERVLNHAAGMEYAKVKQEIVA